MSMRDWSTTCCPPAAIGRDQQRVTAAKGRQAHRRRTRGFTMDHKYRRKGILARNVLVFQETNGYFQLKIKRTIGELCLIRLFVN
jgi:hypothetical protein